MLKNRTPQILVNVRPKKVFNPESSILQPMVQDNQGPKCESSNGITQIKDLNIYLSMYFQLIFTLGM